MTLIFSGLSGFSVNRQFRQPLRRQGMTMKIKTIRHIFMPKVSVFIFCSDVQGNFTSHRKVNVTSVIPESIKKISMTRANGCLMRNSHKYFESLFRHFCI
jgi:hypothetical protein